MSTFYVKKDGSGTHDSIQSAIYDAQNGDIINVGEGTWSENIEFYKAVELVGAGKDLTFIEGQLANQVFAGCSFYQGEDVINVPSTSNLVRGRRVTGSGLAANSRISEILSPTQIKVSPTTTASNITKTITSVVSGSNTITLPNTTSVVVGMKVTGAGVSGIITAINSTTKVITLDTANTSDGSGVLLTFRTARVNVTLTMSSTFPGSIFPGTIQIMNVALDGWKIKDMTVTGFDNSNPNSEAVAIGISAAAHSNWVIENCKVVASGDSALVTAFGFTSINGVVRNCIFDGKTFVGTNPASGNQYSVWNSPRQLVVIQAARGIDFIDNQVLGSTGGLTVDGIASYNTAVTVDCVNAIVTGNTINTESGYGYGLRVRGFYPTVEDNFNIGTSSGYYILPNHSVGVEVSAGAMVFDATKYWICTQNHTSTALTKPSGADGASYWSEITLQQVNDSGIYGVGLAIIGSNSNIVQILVTTSQTAGESFVSFEMSKEVLKQNSAISSHPVFSDETNWNMVSYVFKHDSSARRLVGSFKDFSSTKKSKLKPNMAVGDKFELHKIILATSPRDLLVLKRSEISGASGFDFNLASDGPEEENNGGGGNGGGGSIPLLTTENGSLNGYSVGVQISNTSEVNTGTSMGWAFSQSQTVLFNYSSSSAPQGVYKIRYYFSSLNITDDSAIFKIQGYSAAIEKTKSQVMAEFEQNGYIEFEYEIAPGYGIQLNTYSPYSGVGAGSITYTVSKIEIHPL